MVELSNLTMPKLPAKFVISQSQTVSIVLFLTWVFIIRLCVSLKHNKVTKIRKKGYK